MNDLLSIQPESCRHPLPIKDHSHKSWYKFIIDKHPHIIRVLEFDPTEIYERINNSHLKVSPLKRNNTLYMNVLFPDIEGLCSCGCGAELKGRRTRWATDSCSRFAVAVWAILSGRSATYEKYVLKYYDGCCVCCGEELKKHEIDHIVPVHKGGGLCWLSNLQPLNIQCHKDKTYDDVHLKPESKKQLKLDL